MLTNFTEFNRCPPDPAPIDFATFGTTAIVHAGRRPVGARDARGAAATSSPAPGRSAPTGRCGSGCLDRHAVEPLRRGGGGEPRRRADRRWRWTIRASATGFAAAWAVGARPRRRRAAGVASFAPAMTAGPLGLGRDGALWPIYHAVAALAALGEAEVEVAGGRRRAGRDLGRGKRGVRGIVANLGPDAARVVAPAGAAALTLDAEAAGDAGWLDRPGGGTGRWRASRWRSSRTPRRDAFAAR